MSDIQSRQFMFILYEDTDTYDIDVVLMNIKSYFDEYAYILHNSDYDVNGELKKNHYHVIGRCKTPRLLSGVSNIIGLPSNYIQPVHNFKKSLQYLIHLNDKNKYQYDIADIVTNIPNISKFIIKETESVIVKELYSLRCKGYSMEDLFNYSIDNNCYDVFRRNFNIIKSIYDERKNFYNKYKTEE